MCLSISGHHWQGSIYCPSLIVLEKVVLNHFLNCCNPAGKKAPTILLDRKFQDLNDKKIMIYYQRKSLEAINRGIVREKLTRTLGGH